MDDVPGICVGGSDNIFGKIELFEMPKRHSMYLSNGWLDVSLNLGGKFELKI